MASIQSGSGGETMSGGFQPASGPASEHFELGMCISSSRIIPRFVLEAGGESKCQSDIKKY